MTAQEAYILAKAYTNKSIEGAGSLKGAACQIKSIEAITGGHRITFEWEDNDGEVSTDTMDVMDGADGSDGVGISSITYKETDAHGNYVYTVTLTDTNTYDIICPKGAQGETGATGATGNGIASIEKTSTAGLVDTYTITYTNGQTTTFTVTNGESITVDSAMSGSSTNPVQNKVITEALALKQNAEDNNLTTTSKTVVGGINELKSGLTTLDTEVNGDATTYPYADVITIEDAVPSNLADCNVKIEPMQDLHGYDKPWVGGAGKNKCAGTYTTTTNGGVTFTAQSDGTVKATNTSSGYAYVNSSEFTIKAGTYTFSGAPSGNSKYVLAIYSGATLISQISNGTETDVTFESDTNIVVRCVVNGADVTTGVTYKPMIRLATETDATFAPYTNICPITGHTEASVQRDGKNLLDDSIVGLYQAASDPTVKRYGYAPFAIKAGVYTISYTNTQPTVKLYLTDMTDWTYVEIDASGTTVTITKDTTVFLRSGLSTSEIDFRNNFFDTIVELGQNATTYEPYAGKTYTIALGDTIYGGTVDFDSGVMTVDRVCVDAGDLTYNEGSVAFYSSDITDFKRSGSVGNQYATYCISSEFEYHGNSDYEQDANGFSLYYNPSVPGCRLTFNKTNFDGYTTTQFKQWLTDNNVQICYELATPTTIQLTPQQIQLLKGQNTLTASTGQISVTANGVSGSIGALTEEVNDHEERIEALESCGGSDDYTNTEQKVGTWLGADLYRKSYYFDNVTKGAHSLDITNLDKIIKVEGGYIERFVDPSVRYGFVPFPYSNGAFTSDNPTGVECSITDGTVIFNWGANHDSLQKDAVLTVYYTKTT